MHARAGGVQLARVVQEWWLADRNGGGVHMEVARGVQMESV